MRPQWELGDDGRYRYQLRAGGEYHYATKEAKLEVGATALIVDMAANGMENGTRVRLVEPSPCGNDWYIECVGRRGQGRSMVCL